MYVPEVDFHKSHSVYQHGFQVDHRYPALPCTLVKDAGAAASLGRYVDALADAAGALVSGES